VRYRYRPRSRAGRALLWILFIVLVLIVLSLMFGGFQKGTKVNGLGALPRVTAAAVAAR
jgi:hypothetical protein